MKKTALCIVILLSCCTASLFAQAIGPDEIAIRALIDKFTPMWTTKDGAAIFKKISSETNFMQFSSNAIVTRDEFIQLLSQMLRENPPVRHTYTIHKIVISGDLAFERGIMELVRTNGQTMKKESFNVFFREESGWKLISNLPVAELRRAMTD